MRRIPKIIKDTSILVFCILFLWIWGAPTLSNLLTTEYLQYRQESFEDTRIIELRKLNKDIADKFEKRLVLGVGSDFGYGSAVRIDEGVYITNQHVVGNDLIVKLYDGKSFRSAIVIDSNAKLDLAIVTTHYKPSKLDLNTIKAKFDIGSYRGQEVVAVGYAHGETIIASKGFIRTFREVRNNFYIAGDYFLAGGMSGGGLFSKDGKILGINSSKYLEKYLDFHVSGEQIGMKGKHTGSLMSAPSMSIPAEVVIDFMQNYNDNFGKPKKKKKVVVKK